jgi:hypothetical protein
MAFANLRHIPKAHEQVADRRREDIRSTGIYCGRRGPHTVYFRPLLCRRCRRRMLAADV